MEMETGGRQRDAERARRARVVRASVCGRANTAGAPAAWGCVPGDEWLVRSRRPPGLCQGKGAQWPGDIIIIVSPSSLFHLPKSRPGHAVLETSVSSPPPHPPITHAIPLGHGDCNRRRTLQLGTRDVAAKICPSTALPCSTAAIPGFNPAARSTHADVSVSHGTRRGKEK